jgi:hypothetical protein
MNDVITDTTFVQHNVDEEDQLTHRCHHNHKLAITFGFIKTTCGHVPLQRFKDMKFQLW